MQPNCLIIAQFPVFILSNDQYINNRRILKRFGRFEINKDLKWIKLVIKSKRLAVMLKDDWTQNGSSELSAKWKLSLQVIVFIIYLRLYHSRYKNVKCLNTLKQLFSFSFILFSSLTKGIFSPYQQAWSKTNSKD